MAKDTVSLHSGHRSRMRERILREGLSSLEDHEILEYLLYHVISRQNTNELAHRLLNRFGTLSGVLEAPMEELSSVEGVGVTAAMFLHSYPEMFHLYQLDKAKKVRRLCSFPEIGEYALSWLSGQKREQVLFVLLDAMNRILFSEIVYEGSTSMSEIYTRDLVRRATRFDASSAILAHNHPSGEFCTSREDIETTEKVSEALQQVEVMLIDHVIVGGSDFVSLASIGCLPHIFDSDYFDHPPKRLVADRGRSE